MQVCELDDSDNHLYPGEYLEYYTELCIYIYGIKKTI